jgi:L-ascorbate oxidase
MTTPCAGRRALAAASLGLACLTFAAAGSAVFAADSPEQVMENPPLLKRVVKATREAVEKGAAQLKPGAPGVREVAEYDLNIVFTPGEIYNPATGRYDQVNLRTYQGDKVNREFPYISPEIDIDPGDTIRINLNNLLPADPSCLPTPTAGEDAPGPNTPHCFNGTNLHTHGLWVNPGGNGDNVLISINPGVEFQYEINVPVDHPAGTFWYHTHRHGSTAMQVSSGMAGALIIRGKRPPTLEENGDIDTLLKPTPSQSFKERVLVLQQIQYACRDKDGYIKGTDFAQGGEKYGPYVCDPGDVGQIDEYDIFQSTFEESGRYTTINGRVIPTFEKAAAGQIERWRVIHGGVRDTINLELHELTAMAADPMKMTAEEQDRFIGASCKDEALPQYLIAADGLTTTRINKSESTVFQPGYRWDALMVFPKPGFYCVIDGSVPPSANVNPKASPTRRLLGFVEVGAGKNVSGDLTAYLKDQLVTAAKYNLQPDIRAEVTKDLKDNLKLTRFVPHASLAGVAKFGTQNLVFNIDTKVEPNLYEVGTFYKSPDDNDTRPYDPAIVDRKLILGTVDEWNLTTQVGSHPFHIHVNPFEIVAIYDPNGKDVSAPGAVDDYGGVPDPQYPGLKGMFKDSIWVKKSGSGTYKIVARTKYQRYIGEFVLHCHILDHEDQGMMQNVSIVLPDGAGGASHGHH